MAAAEDSPLFTPEEKLSGRKRERQTEVGAPPGKKLCSTTSHNFSIAYNKYKKLEKVGAGSYGSVYKAVNKSTGELVAIKEQKVQQYEDFPINVLREVQILRRLDHTNIVKLHEVVQTKNDELVLVLEFCHSSLYDLLRSNEQKLAISEMKYISLQLLEAITYMHDRGVLHRDLATKNVLINYSGEIKVCDFGISRLAFAFDAEFGLVSSSCLEDPNTIVTLPYRAIELLLGECCYGSPLDVWSIACIIGEMLLYQIDKRKPFFAGRDETSMVKEILRTLGHEQGGEIAYIKHFFKYGEVRRVHADYNIADQFYDLLGSLFRLSPTRRLQAANACKHSWFTEKPAPKWQWQPTHLTRSQ